MFFLKHHTEKEYLMPVLSQQQVLHITRGLSLPVNQNLNN